MNFTYTVSETEKKFSTLTEALKNLKNGNGTISCTDRWYCVVWIIEFRNHQFYDFA